MSSDRQMQLRSQSGGLNRSHSRIPLPPRRNNSAASSEARRVNTTLPRVATITNAPAPVEQPSPPTVPTNPTTDVETPGVPDSNILDENTLREAGILDDEITAPSGGVQAEASSASADFHKICARVLTEIQPVCSRMVNDQLEEFMVDMRGYISCQIADANISQQVVSHVSEALEQRKAQWEIPTSLTRTAVQAYQERVDETTGRLLFKIDNLEKELSTVKTELASYKNRPPTGDLSPPNPDTRSRDRDRKRVSRNRGSSRRSSSGSSSDGSNSCGYSSSDSEKEKSRRRALRKTLTELNPSNRMFAKVLSYKNYRLYKRNPSESGRVRRKVSSWTKRMATTVGKFNGSDPISVIQFLAKFKVAADNNGIPEGGAKLVLRNFLSGRAAEAFDASLYVDAIGIDTVGIQTWSDAVHWLLQTFAKDTYIRDVVHKLRGLQQKEQETENDFGHRVLSAYSRIPGVYTQDDQIVTFIEGLHEAVSAGVTRDRQISPYRYDTLHSVMELAHSHGTAERARGPNNRKDKPIAKRTLLVEPSLESTGSSATPYGGSAHSGEVAALAMEGSNFSPPSTPSYATYFSSEANPAEAVPDDHNRPTSDPSAALPIFPNRNPRLPADAQPYRPGWVDRGVKYPTVLKNPTHGNNNSTASGTDQRSCFVCASRSHYVPQCPFVTETVRMEARRNLMEATPAQRALLPRWTFAMAGIPTSNQEPSAPPPLQPSTATAGHTDNSQGKGKGM